MKCRPSGMNIGFDCAISPTDWSSVVNGLGAPPAWETFSSEPPEPENTITPPLFQLPVEPLTPSLSTCGGPPATSIFFKLPEAKKPK